MTHDPDVATIEVPIKFLDLRADDEPDLVVPVTLATCPCCRMSGYALDQSKRSVEKAITEMQNFCPGHKEACVYVAAPGTEPPMCEGDPFEKSRKRDAGGDVRER